MLPIKGRVRAAQASRRSRTRTALPYERGTSLGIAKPTAPSPTGGGVASLIRSRTHGAPRAEDRPGLVEKLSEAVTEEGGNWLESRMAHLAEMFAGIVRVEIPGDSRCATR
jgi:hypothetical protein